MTQTLRIGQLPGKINEFAVERGTTLKQALELAGLDATGYEVKVDGAKVDNFDVDVSGATLVLLSKMVKGNSDEARLVRVGVMPGKIEEYAFTPPTTFNQVFAHAGIDPTGFEVKADGVKVDNFESNIGYTGLILLSKMVKGN